MAEMTVRALGPADLAAQCKVAGMAYHFACKPEEQRMPASGTILGCFDAGTPVAGGTLVAQLHYEIREANWGSTALPMVCIGGVASLPNHRNGGAVRKIFEELERLAQREGWAFGALYPFADGYYRQFGYERAARHFALEVPMAAVSAFAKSTPQNEHGRLELIECGEEEAISEELLKVYNAYVAGIPMMLRRGQAQKGRFAAKPLENCWYCFLWHNGNGEAQGYLQLHLNGNVLEVSELCYLSAEALRGMLCFLRGYASKAERVRFCALPGSTPVAFLLNEHSANKTEYAIGASVRVYDAAQALQAFGYPGSGEFCVAVAGDSMAQNNGTYRVVYQDGAVQIERNVQIEANVQNAPVVVSRETLALLISGQIKDMTALQCCAQVSDTNGAEAVLRAFSQAKLPMMWDGF